ncbi:hypothetical protein ACO0RG_000073 [Hanseniaspora osmophila]|uniref:Serine/threonine-protein phosphatase 2A activator n=1 Tax=Hanseniaspora osmophila TaxID=56408 RepID=A0A1E5R4T4_9ASCO|nr:Serine/threonine-protein phosphatase 2A activator 1 [Hanseniaspora osmophila]
MNEFQLAETAFSKPAKKIFDAPTTQVFQSSVALHRLRYYIEKYCSMVEGVTYDHKIIQECISNDAPQKHPVLEKLLKYVFTPLSTQIKETPPLPGPTRFGNFACRDWHDKINKEMPLMLERLLDDFANESTVGGDTVTRKYKESLVELQYYLLNAFGSKERLDYGTGHELSFLAFLGCLDMLGLFKKISKMELLAIFFQYCALVESLILTYNLEPAGSHGVWGLDDHFHLSYMFGASQMVKNKNFQGISPKIMLADPYIVDDHYMEILYFWNIKFVKTVKKGPFEEHSPILYDISRNVKQWSKVLKGLTKMYDDEVLNKFPVVQHFWFGTGFYPWTSMNDGTKLVESEQELASDKESQKEEVSKQTQNTQTSGLSTSAAAALEKSEANVPSSSHKNAFANMSDMMASRRGANLGRNVQPGARPCPGSPGNKQNILTNMPPPSMSYPTRQSRR